MEIAFRKHYGVAHAPLSGDTLAHSVYARYASIMDLLDNDLQAVIHLRNKLAHGQWEYPLNDDGDDIAQLQMDDLRSETILSLQFKKTLLTYLSSIVNDLVVSRPAFERDFDTHYERIVNTRRNLHRRPYDRYVTSLRAKHERGIARRARV